MYKKRVKGKGRKTKKKQENLYRFGNGEKILFSYSQKRKMDREKYYEQILNKLRTMNIWNPLPFSGSVTLNNPI